MTTNEKKMMMKKKTSIENNNFCMFEIFKMRNSIEQISSKYHINDTTSFSNFFKTSTFDVEIFLK